MTEAPKRIWVDNARMTEEGLVGVWGEVVHERGGIPYILATPEALAASPEIAKLVAEAEARGMERARPTDRAIQDLAYHFWSVHPNEIGEAGYEHVSRGGTYENPRAAWYADQIKALIDGASIRRAAEETGT